MNPYDTQLPPEIEVGGPCRGQWGPLQFLTLFCTLTLASVSGGEGFLDPVHGKDTCTQEHVPGFASLPVLFHSCLLLFLLDEKPITEENEMVQWGGGGRWACLGSMFPRRRATTKKASNLMPANIAFLFGVTSMRTSMNECNALTKLHWGRWSFKSPDSTLFKAL